MAWSYIGLLAAASEIAVRIPNRLLVGRDREFRRHHHGRRVDPGAQSAMLPRLMVAR
jgi:hypothetical protein